MTDLVSITRVFEVPRERVWREFTAPDRFADWFGGAEGEVPPSSVAMDVRVGGAWRLTMRIRDGEVSWHGEYREVVEPERIVFYAQRPTAASCGARARDRRVVGGRRPDRNVVRAARLPVARPNQRRPLRVVALLRPSRRAAPQACELGLRTPRRKSRSPRSRPSPSAPGRRRRSESRGRLTSGPASAVSNRSYHPRVVLISNRVDRALRPRSKTDHRIARPVPNRVPIQRPSGTIRKKENPPAMRGCGWRDPDSNRGHHDFQSCALPTELSRRGGDLA